VTADAHVGLKQAISTVLSGATWRRCRGHFKRNLLATVPQGAREPLAANRLEDLRATPIMPARWRPDTRWAIVCARAFPRPQRSLEEGLGRPGVPPVSTRTPAAAAQHQRPRAPTKKFSGGRMSWGPFRSPTSTVRLIGALLLDEAWSTRRAALFQCGVDDAALGAGLAATTQEILAPIA
jgi:hypothetical protein